MSRRGVLSASELALVERARRYFADRSHKYRAECLPRFPEPADMAGMPRSTFIDIMDRCLVLGFRDKRWPILSAGMRSGLSYERISLGISDFQWTTGLRTRGASCVRELDGDGCLAIMAWLERNGLDVAAFIADRRDITPAQVRLIHTARHKVGMSDADFYRVLATYGGVNSTADLDARGCSLVMAYLRMEGFEASSPAPASDDSIGRRPGFASPEQLGLIRALWREWSGADDEGALCAWLERSHRISALRFMTGAAAGKAITALKAMKRRRGSPPSIGKAG